MARFGVISPPVPGHLNPFIALGLTLRDRGHDVMFVHMADVATRVRDAGLEFAEIGAPDHPPGSLQQSLDRLGRLHGLAALRHVVAAVARTTEMFGRDAPDALRAAGVDALLVDQTEPVGAAIAQRLGLPFVTVCNALMVNREASVPPPFTPWSYRDNVLARLRNRAGYRVSDQVLRPVRRVLSRWRREWGLPPCDRMDDTFSPLAQISQQPPAFDFPRRALPPTFHYCGPFRHPEVAPVSFPWERLDGRPVVYGSLGTLQGSKADLFRCFADACADLDVQLVLSHGGALGPEAVQKLSDRALVVSYAPQEALLARAAVALTHAGLNTVLDALTHGVPLVAVPLAFEQPAIAARIVWTGSGRAMPLSRLTTARLRAALSDVRHDPAYRTAAARVRDSIHAAGGASRAADVIERAVGGGHASQP